MTPEGKIKALVKRRFHEEFPTAYHFMPVQNGMGAPSLDLLWCIEGLFVAVETKAPGGKPTPRQEITMKDILDAGGMVFVIDGPRRCETAIMAIREWVSYYAGHQPKEPEL